MNLRGRMLIPLLLLSAAAAQPQQKWVEVHSPNFAVSTDAGEKRGREIALRFEQMRRLFLALIPREKIRDSEPLYVIAFKSNQELKDVAPLWKGKPIELDGIYLKGQDGSFIALDASSTAGWRPVFHEYAHFLLNTNLPPTPLWFDEGFADYYSTIRADKVNYYLGEAPPYYGELLNGGMMPVERLFAVVHESKEYNENSDRRSLFYAQSWLMVHYLLDTNKIQEATDYFVKSMYGGLSIAQAIESAFKMTPSEMNAELRRYLTENKVQVRQMPVPEGGMQSATYVYRKLKDYEAQALIANLQLHTEDRLEPALKTFQMLAEQYPDLTAAHRGLAFAYLRKGDLKQAEKAFRRAADLDSDDPHVYYFIAHAIYRNMGERIDPEDLVQMNELLEKAIKLEPSFADAYNLKAFALSNASNVTEAIHQMKIAVSLEPRNEQFQLNLVNQYMLARRWEEATVLLDRLKISHDPGVAKAAVETAAKLQEWKANPLSQLAGLTPDSYTAPQWRRKATSKDNELEHLEAAQTGVEAEPEPEPAKGPVRFARGVLVSAECPANGAATLNLTVGAKRIKLHAADAKSILVIGADGFQCGWKNKRVAINYRERTATDGDLISVEITRP